MGSGPSLESRSVSSFHQTLGPLNLTPDPYPGGRDLGIQDKDVSKEPKHPYTDLLPTSPKEILYSRSRSRCKREQTLVMTKNQNVPVPPPSHRDLLV